MPHDRLPAAIRTCRAIVATMPTLHHVTVTRLANVPSDIACGSCGTLPPLSGVHVLHLRT